MAQDPNEQFADPAFPVLGIDLSRPFDVQRDGTTFEGENVRAFEPSTLRGRGGSRPGLSRYIIDPVPAGHELIQHLNVIVTADGEAIIPPYDGPPDIYDPSTPGPPESWPPRRPSRTPFVPIPPGGGGVPPYKNAPEHLFIVWPRPDPILYGTLLSHTQLNAVAHDHNTNAVVPGSYAYNPGTSALLDVGADHPMAVIFTPDDLHRYARTPAVNAITVIPSGEVAYALLFCCNYNGAYQTLVDDAVHPRTTTEIGSFSSDVYLNDEVIGTVTTGIGPTGLLFCTSGNAAAFLAARAYLDPPGTNAMIAAAVDHILTADKIQAGGNWVGVSASVGLFHELAGNRPTLGFDKFPDSDGSTPPDKIVVLKLVNDGLSWTVVAKLFDGEPGFGGTGMGIDGSNWNIGDDPGGDAGIYAPTNLGDNFWTA
jgi:hypothetical protein